MNLRPLVSQTIGTGRAFAFHRVAPLWHLSTPVDGKGWENQACFHRVVAGVACRRPSACCQGSSSIRERPPGTAGRAFWPISRPISIAEPAAGSSYERGFANEQHSATAPRFTRCASANLAPHQIRNFETKLAPGRMI